jgi:glycine oxidase
MNKTPESVLVVGSGVIGLSMAYRLATRGVRVTLVDRGTPGRECTWAAGGMLAPTCEGEVATQALVALGYDSLRRYPAWVSELESLTGRDCGLGSGDTWLVATDHDERGQTEHMACLIANKGGHVERMSLDDAKAMVSLLTPRITLAYRVQGDRWIEPRALCHALLDALSRLGVDIRENHEATYQDFDQADAVVLACGAWHDSLHFVQRGGIRPIRGQTVHLTGAPLLNHVIRTPRVYLVPRRDGVVIGATSEEQGFDRTSPAGGVYELLRYGIQTIPALYELNFSEVAVGFRSATRDHMPILDQVPGAPIYVATGHYRDGILLAPASADHMVEMIMTGEKPDALASFVWRTP